MSIADEITRLKKAKKLLSTAISSKGVDIDSNLSISDYYKKVFEIPINGGDYEHGYEAGYEAAKNSVVCVIPFLKQGQFTSLNIFKEPTVTLNFDSWTGSLLNLFQITVPENKNTTVEQLIINMPNNSPKSIQQMLYSSSLDCDDETLKHITFNVDTSSCTSFPNAFAGLRALEIVDGKPLDFSSNINNVTPFQRCYALIDFRVVPNTINKSFSIHHSSLLSSDTIKSIIDGLADLTGGTARTLTLHSTVGEKLSDVQKATIISKNWGLVY